MNARSTCKQHRHPDADADAVHRGDHRLRERGERVEEAREARTLVAEVRGLGVGTEPAHLAEVLAGREAAAGAGEDDARDVVARGRLFQRVAAQVVQLVVERVQRFGTVEREHADASRRR